MREKQRLEVNYFIKFCNRMTEIQIDMPAKAFSLNKQIHLKLLASNYRGRHSTPNPLLFSLPASDTHSHTQVHTCQDPHTVPEHSTPRSDHPRWDPARKRRTEWKEPTAFHSCTDPWSLFIIFPPPTPPIIITTVSSSQLDHEPALF